MVFFLPFRLLLLFFNTNECFMFMGLLEKRKHCILYMYNCTYNPPARLKIYCEFYDDDDDTVTTWLSSPLVCCAFFRITHAHNIFLLTFRFNHLNCFEYAKISFFLFSCSRCLRAPTFPHIYCTF